MSMTVGCQTADANYTKRYEVKIVCFPPKSNKLKFLNRPSYHRCSREILSAKKIGIVGSSHATLEELYLLNRLSKINKSPKYLRGHFGDDDGILLSADRSPNLRGALLSGFTNVYPEDNLKILDSDIKKGKVDAILVFKDDIVEAGVEKNR